MHPAAKLLPLKLIGTRYAIPAIRRTLDDSKGRTRFRSKRLQTGRN